MAEAGFAYKVTVKLADRVEVVKPVAKARRVPTVSDVCDLVGTDANGLTPTIGGRAADPRTPLVPNAVVEFC